MTRFFVRSFVMPIGVLALAACSFQRASVTPQVEQNVRSTVRDDVPTIEVSRADRKLARSAHRGRVHIFYNSLNRDQSEEQRRLAPDVTRYPGDMKYYGGPVMKSAKAYDLYVTTPSLPQCKTEKCWGNPEEFLQGLTGSPIAGLLKQYTGASADAYRYGSSLHIVDEDELDNVFYDNDIYVVLAAAYHKLKSHGYNTIYHIFLPPGSDTCFSFTQTCYSPERESTNLFCAYHSFVEFGSKLQIVYSVEPYQNYSEKVRGKEVRPCGVPRTPSGTNQLDNAMAASLGHESFEAFTDPGYPLGWYNATIPSEVADECETFYAVQPFSTGKWFWQLIYSNKIHGCSDNSP
ncbi:MAG: hypothetical protein JOZ77_08445 [Candidatus Eremiobacteraeota bacterium]|nr:hypothetical protein [Candidatus Eremiobacteraeota bacterium]